jgi:hypothetical protein
LAIARSGYSPKTPIAPSSAASVSNSRGHATSPSRNSGTIDSTRGFEGGSAQMLVEAMGIGRKSLYATFGDKWQLYCSAASRYGRGKCAAHFEALRSGAAPSKSSGLQRRFTR